MRGAVITKGGRGGARSQDSPASPGRERPSRRRSGFRAGTHRVRSPAETWSVLRGLLPRAGITRVADVTALDRLGIPVCQAVRPASRNLSVSQGKGATPEAARVSAAMEAIELWHAEDLGPCRRSVMSPREMRYDNAIPLAALRWKPAFSRVSAVPMPGCARRGLGGEREAWIPRSMLELDFTHPEELPPRPVRG